MSPTPISVGITTRDRPESLRRCVASLALVRDLVSELLVFDDGSRLPVAPALPAGLTDIPLRVLRNERAAGAAVGRNRMMEVATQPVALMLDDDAAIVSRDAIVSAIDVMRSDRRVGAVAFALAESDGSPWPAAMQPAPGSAPCRVRSFIGFAHLLRRDVFLALGGYRDLFEVNGEEKEYCLRLADAGYDVVFLPDARVAHIPDKAGRNQQQYLRQVARNDCFNTLLNDPAWRVAWMLPARYALYFRMRRGWRVRDRGGAWWLARSIVRALPRVIRERRPVRTATLRRWAALGVHGEPYAPPPRDRP
jgi:GT2 family glycosyltransferase